MSLSKNQRTRLAATVGKIRTLVEADISEQASGRFGLHAEGRRGVHVEAEDALDLGPADQADRRQLVDVLDYLRGEGIANGEAVARLIREACFTIVNRLLAIRVAEAIGVVPPALAEGVASSGFREFAQLFPLVASNIELAYWQFLQVCGDELAASVPSLFDRRHPVAAFRPRHKTIEEIVDLLDDDELYEIWKEPETLGWSYQFFNSQDERRSMREQSQAPRNSRELAVRNQFFTPSYVVDWLLQNTLGRRLRESGYELDLPLLEGAPGGGETALDLESLTILDPAVGSGHFLLGAYDMLERIWAERGTSPAEAASKILPTLHGIEIDHRAAQVAQTVLVLRAKRAGATAVQAPAIVTAQGMPRNRDVRHRVLSALPSNVKEIFEDLDGMLSQAPVLGSLLRVEERLQRTMASRFATPQLGDAEIDDPAEMENLVLRAAGDLAAGAEASPAERLFAADSSEALHFVELLRRRYDIVLMNPPFGDSVPDTKDYLKKAYGKSASNLYSAFVHRGHELLAPDGYLGAITDRSGFFLKTFAGWREKILLPGLVCVADLGRGVLQDALVGTAAYVIRGTVPGQKIHVRRLLNVADKSELSVPGSGELFVRPREAFDDLPNRALSYWVAPTVIDVFHQFRRFKEDNEARQGLATGDDFRFVRLWWEVPLKTIGKNRRWSPFAKGGGYAPWYADLHLVVDWENGGERIKNAGRGRPQNIDFYHRPGLTWSRRTRSAFTVRALPEGSVFADKGCYLAGEDNAALAAWANSRAVSYLMGLLLAGDETTTSGGVALSYEVGILQALPTPDRLKEPLAEVGRAQILAERLRCAWDETDRSFSTWTDKVDSIQDFADRLIALGRVDQAVIAAYNLDEAGIRAIDEEAGPAVASYPSDILIDEEELARLYLLPEGDLVDHILATRGGTRFIALQSHLVDRRLELLCHHFSAHPTLIAEIITRLGLRPPGEQEARARALLSYLVGAAFGRWDVRPRDVNESIVDPWAVVNPIPPGMLTTANGEPSRRAPMDYPLELPPEPLLFQDVGNPWDISYRVEIAAEVVCGSTTKLETALKTLNQSSLESYLRASFFEDHLNKYGRSRRRAPIYWQLGVPGWEVWLYYPELSRETLFAIVRAGEEKLRRTESLIRQLQDPEPVGTRTRDLRERLEHSESLRDSIRGFLEKIRAIAQSGWVPDLNDGAVLCAAPLADLLVNSAWRRDAANAREELAKGYYPWASVQQSYFRGRS